MRVTCFLQHIYRRRSFVSYLKINRFCYFRNYTHLFMYSLYSIRFKLFEPFDSVLVLIFSRDSMRPVSKLIYVLFTSTTTFLKLLTQLVPFFQTCFPSFITPPPLSLLESASLRLHISQRVYHTSSI